MPLINVSRVLRNPKFQIDFQVERFAGSSTLEGEYLRNNVPVIVDCKGSIQPASQNDVLLFVPEGERDNSYIKCYSLTEIKKGDGVTVESDKIIWNDGKYRVTHSKFYDDFGYWFVIAEECGNEFNQRNI